MSVELNCRIISSAAFKVTLRFFVDYDKVYTHIRHRHITNFITCLFISFLTHTHINIHALIHIHMHTHHLLVLAPVLHVNSGSLLSSPSPDYIKLFNL